MTIIYKNFIYMEDRGFLFAYVPKVACTNWKSLLRYMSGKEDWLDNKLAHDKALGGLRYLDLNGEDAEILLDPSIRKYANTGSISTSSQKLSGSSSILLFNCVSHLIGTCHAIVYAYTKVS